jgi:hypothetical protein
MKPLSCSIAARAALLGATLAMLVFAPREALSQGRPDRNARGEVCVYEHADYGGWEKCFGVGESIRDIGNLRDQISSVRVRGGAEVAFFEHPNLDGAQVYIDSDIRDLRRWDRRWNDEVDSLEVSSAGFRGRRPDRSARREDRVCVYQHTNYQGHSQCWDAGDEIVDLKQIGWNDGISSIRTFGGTRLAVYEHSGFQGRRLIVDSDIPDLTHVNTDGSHWNDRISSVRIGDGWDRRPGRR